MGKKNAKSTLTRRNLVYDTFRSWRDRLPEGGMFINMFHGHGIEHNGPPVTNCGFGSLQAFGDADIEQVGLRVMAESEQTARRFVEDASVRFSLSQRRVCDFPLTLIGSDWDRMSSELRDEGLSIGEDMYSHEGRALFVDVNEHVVKGTSMDFRVEFREMAEEINHMFHERGPNARWLKLIAYVSYAEQLSA